MKNFTTRDDGFPTLVVAQGSSRGAAAQRNTPVVTLGFGRGGEASRTVVGREQVGHQVFSLASHNLIMSRSMSDGNTTATAIISPVCDLGNPQPPKRDFEPRVLDRKIN
jgi:hypothetical protein